MGSRSHRRVLGRIEAVLRSSDDTGLAVMFDSFTARFAGQAMPQAEDLGRRRSVRPLAVLVFVIGVVLVAATTGFATTSPCASHLTQRPCGRTMPALSRPCGYRPTRPVSQGAARPEYPPPPSSEPEPEPTPTSREDARRNSGPPAPA